MALLSVLTSLVGPVIDGVFRWKEGEDKMEISRQQYELLKRQLEHEMEIRLSEEARKPTSEFRSFLLDYEGKASEQAPWMRNLRSSVRPFITYWSVIIISLLMFGFVDTVKLEANLKAVPDPLWQIFLAVFGFWFGGRALMQVAEAWKKGEVEKQRADGDARVREAAQRAAEGRARAEEERQRTIRRLQDEQATLPSKPSAPDKRESPAVPAFDFWEDQNW